MNTLVGLWKTQARRINALTLRERAIMFVSLSVALVAVTDTLVLSPRMAEQQALAKQLRQNTREVDELRLRLQPARDDTPAGRMARELEGMRAEQAALDAEIGRSADSTTIRLPELLERVLRRHERLLLQRLATLPPSAAAPGGLPRQAVDIAMRGSYPDLARYVAETEAALPALRWGELRLTRRDEGAELLARVYLPGAAP